MTILDRKKPIAKLVPIHDFLGEDPQQRLSEMATQGLIALPNESVGGHPPFLTIASPPSTKPVGAVEALLKEREEGR